MSKETGRVLRRKLGAVHTRGYSPALQRRLATLLEYAAGKGASATLAVGVEATVTDSRVVPLAALIEDLPQPGLCALLESPSGGSGLFGLGMRLVDHFVEILAGGEPGEPEDGEPGDGEPEDGEQDGEEPAPRCALTRVRRM